MVFEIAYAAVELADPPLLVPFSTFCSDASEQQSVQFFVTCGFQVAGGLLLRLVKFTYLEVQMEKEATHNVEASSRGSSARRSWLQNPGTGRLEEPTVGPEQGQLWTTAPMAGCCRRCISLP